MLSSDQCKMSSNAVKNKLPFNRVVNVVNIDIDIDTINDTCEVLIVDTNIDDTFMSKYRKRYQRYFYGCF